VAEAAEVILALGGADVVLEASGNHRAVEKGLPYLKENGIFAMYGIPRQPYLMDREKSPAHFRQFRIDPETEKAMEFVCDALATGQIPVELFLTHQWSLEQLPEGYKAVCRGEVIKGLVHMYPEETV
jgi:threonine dehydrogenase-like Zn-dependent dehydrogenase